jgi:transitional endoplasmic reticulum ATPase
MWCGESEKRLTEVFAKAKETAKSGTPILLFIDEVDALGYARTMTPEPNDASSNRHLIATFLKLLDGIQDIPNIVVVGATNRLWSVDEALRRPGRLGSAILYVPPPDEHARKELFKHYSWETPGHTNLKFKELARQTPWFSGDDIRNICRDVHFKLAQNNIKYKKNRHAEMRDFIKLIKNKKLQLQTINWMRQVTRYYDEGKIDSKEIDRKLLEDIERFRKNEFSPDRDTREDHDPSFI